MQVQIIPVINPHFRSSGLDIEHVYNTIGLLTDTNMINNYMYDIIQYEINTVKLIDESKYSWRSGIYERMSNNFILSRYLDQFDVNEHMIDKEIYALLKPRVDKALYALKNVHGLDAGYTSGKYYKRVCFHIITIDDVYHGHVYSWQDTSSIGVQGIRVSISNILEKKITGLSIPMIDSTVKRALIDKKPFVVVHEPYTVMISILEKYGFKSSGMNYRMNVQHNPKIDVALYLLSSIPVTGIFYSVK